MAFLILQSVAGLLIAAYLLTFVIFAILRILTGISIQRLGFSSLRHIAYAPKDGIKIEVRGVRITVHRPTFAQPTWISLVIEELKVVVDVRALNNSQAKQEKEDADEAVDTKERPKLQTRLSSAWSSAVPSEPRKNKFWANLIDIKNKVKRLHKVISWLRLVDIRAEQSTFVLVEVGTIYVGNVIVSVDTRRATVDRSKLFQHKKTHEGEQWPAEWTFALRQAMFTPEGGECIEILDRAILNIHGYLRPQTEGLRDASVSIKMGRLHLPYDDFHAAQHQLRLANRSRRASMSPNGRTSRTSPSSPGPDQDDDPSNLPQVLSDARDFVASTLRGIREVSLAIGFIGASQRVTSVQPCGSPLYLNASVKEIGMDLYRLDPKTPEHSMYFSRHEVAHQALITALSASVGLDAGHDHPDRLLYIPMTTATIRTTLPSKLLQFSLQDSGLDLNSNVLFANLVVTSPSVDLDPAHLPIVVAALRSGQRPPTPSSSKPRNRLLPWKLLPRAVVKITIHEPVVRVALPPVETRKAEDFDFDLLISAVSSISLELDSAHNSAHDVKYNATFNARAASHRLYYQTTARQTHDLLLNESISAKAQVTSDPEVLVVASMQLHTLSLFMVRPEIVEGIRQIVHQLRSDVKAVKLRHPKTSKDPNMLRALPPWLHHLELQASDLNFEVAGIDKELSSVSRGLAVHLESFTTEYKAHKDDEAKRPTHRRRGGSQTLRTDHESLRPQSPTSKARQMLLGSPTDGRRVAIHLKGLESFIVESVAHWEAEPFLTVPRAEMALTTSHDGQGPILHVNTHVRSIYIVYSLFRHYAVGVAVLTLKKALSRSSSSSSRVSKAAESTTTEAVTPKIEANDYVDPNKEFVAVDVRISFLQVKAQLPDDPATMLQLADMEAARHRWHTPYFRAQGARLLAESPGLKNTWSRVVSIKTPRLDLRQSRRKHGSAMIMERSLDVVSDAVRIGVPSQLIVYKIFDNFVNTAKTAVQLHHRFVTGSDEYVLQKFPEGPKSVPRVTLRTHAFVFELEDDPFEWKLGTIFRTGMIEQRQRLAREDAYHAKCKHLRRPSRPGNGPVRKDSRHSLSRGRTHSPEHHQEGKVRRPKSARERKRSVSHTKSRGRTMRYDQDGTHELSGFAKTSLDEAWLKLQKYNAQSWKKRIDQSLKYQKGAMDGVRDLVWGPEHMPEDADRREQILELPGRPSLASIMMTDLTMTIDKPTFPMQELPQFLHRVGKGLPIDTQFGLLIPLHAQFDVGELRATLRDYPLPLLHIPALRPGQSPRLSGFSLKTNFVIAEEFRGPESTRDIPIVVIPKDKAGNDHHKGDVFAVDVRRTVSPVKTYSDIKLDVNSTRDTRITWGSSFQPAIQDVMQVIEGFSKPQIDPSEKVGFWDKIRLSFHSRISINWREGGDVHLTLKGSRDPYVVTGHGAGFMFIWRNNVQWNIRQEDDPSKFLTVDSGDFVLAIPDFNKYARRSPELSSSQARGADHAYNPDDVQAFKKVIMKLSGKVRWMLGLVFERNVGSNRRSFDFMPHYNVTLRNPEHVKAISGDKTYDAFDGFRSNHIHMSVSISAPSDREWSVTNLEPAGNYNTVHLTPRFFTHFFAWWSMFSGVMSLPVHQGPLFPTTEKSGKKFGRHLATVKYSLLLSPLFISHVYLHKDGDEFSEDLVSATGLKMRLDSFMLDVHMRREEFVSDVKGHNQQVVTTGMRINQALLDLVKADLRALSVGISGTSSDAIKRATPEHLLEIQQDHRPIALSTFTIPDSDFSWVDVDDFVEIDWALPHSHEPKTSILPLGYAPRFTYRRQTDHGDTISGDPNRQSPFGYEDTHYCIISPFNDSRQIQIQLIKERLAQIDDLLEDHTRAVGDQELHAVREVDHVEEIQKELAELRDHGNTFKRKQKFLANMVDDLQAKMNRETSHQSVHSTDTFGESYFTASHQHGEHHSAESSDNDSEFEGLNGQTSTDHVSDFNNRFVVHNAQLKWSNSLRNIMLRYIHQVSQRRGFVYYTSRRAVKFILDIIEEQKKSSHQPARPNFTGDSTPETPLDGSNEDNVQARIDELLRDGKAFVDADDPDDHDGNRKPPAAAHEKNDDVSQDFVAQNTYHVRLVAPQIQLQSEKNTKSVVLVAARGMRLQVFQIMDKDRISDEVSGLVQRRFALDMDNLQFFVTTKNSFSPHFLPIYSGNSYGTATGSHWPPWAPLEAMFDFHVRTYGFERVVQRTSASLRYDKYNKLRLKYNDSVTDGKGAPMESRDNAESRMDQFWVEFPQLRAICDSSQYYAMYIIVLDLLMWSEPLEKTRNERLEKIMLAADFSDLRGAPEMVMTLQDRIRALEEIKSHFHVNEKHLDRQGLQDRIAMEQDLATCEDELFFIMKAITTSQRKFDERADGAQASGMLRYYISASEIVWHLIKEADQPLAEFQLRHANFERTDNSDGSNHNSVDISQVKGLSLLKNAMYPEIISAYNEHAGAMPKDGHSQMLRVKWLQLEAIAGINVVDHFEVNLHPVRIQLDYDTGKKLFEYVFPGAGVGQEGFSPFLVRHGLPQTEEEGEDEEEEKALQAQREATMHATKDHSTGSLTGAGSLEQRLQPTRALPDHKSASTNRSKGLGINMGESHRPKYLQLLHGGSSMTVTNDSKRTLSTRFSADNLSTSARPARGRQSSATPTVGATPEGSHRKRFHVGGKHRSASADSKHSKRSVTKQSDDLTQMLSRASNYMTLSYIKIPSVVLALSYKGKGQRNIEDVHNLVFRMPTLEYRNKTWSNLDLAMALKKDVIRALVSHTGAIVSNKFSKHKYGKSQQSRLRELASSSVVLSSADVSRAPSASSSVKNLALSVSDNYSTSRPSESASEAERNPSIVRTDTLGSELSSLGRSRTPSPPPSREQEEQQSPPEGSRRLAFSRQFSELTQKANTIRRNLTDGHNGTLDGHAGESKTNSIIESESVPKRSKLVKKLMRPLEKDKS